MDIRERASRIKLLLMDVDGVLTNGRLYQVPNPDGQMVETKGFDSQDGIGPVSYTHLDVYKRQVLHLAVLHLVDELGQRDRPFLLARAGFDKHKQHHRQQE